MKNYKHEIVTETTKLFDYVQCEMYGCKARDDDNWNGDSYGISDTEIKYWEGTAYPEGGSGTEIKVDVCPTCFMNKLGPWLESQGIVVIKEEWDWWL